MEKVVKMTNPNYKISPTRILLKYVNRKLTVEQVRTWVYSLFEGLIQPKKLKTVKLLKDVKILTEDDRPRGFIFIDFTNPEKALQFIRKAVELKDDTIAEIGNSKGDTPIIEFAFDDVKKMRKIEDLKKKQQEEGKDQTNEEEVDDKAVLEKKQFQKQLQNNRKLMAKKLVNDALQQKSDDLAKQAIDSINGLRSRGLKHRLMKKLENKFSHLTPKTHTEPKESLAKASRPIERTKRIEKAKPKIDEKLVKIKHEVKNKNRQLRRENNQKIDKPDEFETNFIKKVQKKAKWSETA